MNRLMLRRFSATNPRRGTSTTSGWKLFTGGFGEPQSEGLAFPRSSTSRLVFPVVRLLLCGRLALPSRKQTQQWIRLVQFRRARRISNPRSGEDPGRCLRHPGSAQPPEKSHRGDRIERDFGHGFPTLLRRFKCDEAGPGVHFTFGQQKGPQGVPNRISQRRWLRHEEPWALRSWKRLRLASAHLRCGPDIVLLRRDPSGLPVRKR